MGLLTLLEMFATLKKIFWIEFLPKTKRQKRITNRIENLSKMKSSFYMIPSSD